VFFSLIATLIATTIVSYQNIIVAKNTVEKEKEKVLTRKGFTKTVVACLLYPA